MRRPLVLLLVVLLGLAGCTARHRADPAPTSTPPAAPLPVAHPTVWLCSPSLASDPCDVPLASSVVHPDGRTTLEPAPRARQPVDCFYVYPTVSGAQTRNAPLRSRPTSAGPRPPRRPASPASAGSSRRSTGS